MPGTRPDRLPFGRRLPCGLVPPGRLLLTSLIELKRWAMSWGADCEVLEPEDLRQDIVQELTTTLHSYG
jgi:hypothetical protein